MKYHFRGNNYHIKRYPATNNRSLKPISAADELLLKYVDTHTGNIKHPLIQHDRFGVLATVLQNTLPQFVTTFSSQHTAYTQQLQQNEIDAVGTILSPLELPKATDLGLMRIPKSLQLFELYLSQFAATTNQYGRNATATMVASFMTRHFTPALLKIASRYVTKIEQSRAEKKARYLKLSEFKTQVPKPEALKTELIFDQQTLEQYYGVFSATRIDYATQFLLSYLAENPLETTADFSFLDLACGNGIIAHNLLNNYPDISGFAIDDFSLAVASAKINLPAERICVLFNDKLDEIDGNSLDLVITNPPFHFGYETNIEVSLHLFKQAKRVLKPSGQLLIVANRHLNYSTHLKQIYPIVKCLKQQPKFEILHASSL